MVLDVKMENCVAESAAQCWGDGVSIDPLCYVLWSELRLSFSTGLIEMHMVITFWFWAFCVSVCWNKCLVLSVYCVYVCVC